MQYTFLGGTESSLAFRATNENGEFFDYGVFNFEAQTDADGVEIVPAKPDYDTYFKGKPTAGAEFEAACENYLVSL